MLKVIARWWAKKNYVWKQSVEASTNELHAKLADRQARERHELAARLANEANEMEARIKEMDAKLDEGFYECESGHETDQPFLNGTASFSCPFPMAEKLNGVCAMPAKFIKRDLMTGQEKYESDKERKDAEDIAKQKRDQAAAQEEEAANSEKHAKYFRDLAQNNHSLADKLRKL